MENFFYEDTFYSELSDLADDFEIDFLPDDWQIKCFESKLEPIVVLNKAWISEIIYNTEEERFPEDYDSIEKRFSKALDAIDFTKANELMPKLYYPSGKSFIITKADILAYIND